MENATESSEPEEGSPPSYVHPSTFAYVTVYSLIIVLVLALNGIIIAGMVRGHLVQTKPVNIYLLSLVVSRMCIALFVDPVQILGLFSEEYLGDFLCKACHLFATGSSATSVMSTTTVAVIKYREIFVSSGGQKSLSAKVAWRHVGVIWLCGHIYAIRAPIINELFFNSVKYSCSIPPRYMKEDLIFLFVDLVCLFAVPAMVITFCYVKIIRYFIADNKRTTNTNTTRGIVTEKTPGSPNKGAPQDSKMILSMDTPEKDVTKLAPPEKNPENVSPPTVGGEDHSQLQRQRRQTVHMVLLIMVLFVVCTLPPYVVRIYTHWNPEATKMIGFEALQMTLIALSFSNAWLNAVLILVCRADIRAHLPAACTCCRKDNKVSYT